MFEGFTSETAQIGDVDINYKMGGSGEPILLLHGYPQTHVMWHKIANQLAEKYTVVAADLRGYGDSSKPKTTETHEPYSKRETAKDQVALMSQLGFEQFILIGHDRGGRVSHRMALDHPQRIKKLVVMDIAPTYTMYKTTDMEFASTYFHWFFLIQPYDFPERFLNANPLYLLQSRFRRDAEALEHFTEEAFNEYVRCLTPETIHAQCEDYRASATIDLEHDQVDIDNGNRIQCPMMCMWGAKGFVGHKYDVIAEWEKWADDVKGRAIQSGHFLPEEAPEETLEAILEFLD